MLARCQRIFASGGVVPLLLTLFAPTAHALEPRLVPSAAHPAVTIPATLEGKRLPMYGGGGLVVAEGDMAEPNLFSVYGADGNLRTQIPFRIPGASRVVVYEYTRSTVGTLVACGFAESPGAQRAPYLAWISADGAEQKIIRTEPYFPYLCTAAPDGTMWTVGLEMDSELRERPEHRNSPVLRRFAPDGRLLGAWLPRSGFPGPAVLVRGFLVASTDRAGWLRWTADNNLEGIYLEITNQGEISEFPLKKVPGFQSGTAAFSGMAFTRDGDVLAAAVPADRKESAAVLLLDRSSAQWRRVSVVSPASAPLYHIYGADQEIAVYVGGDEKSRVRFFRLEK